MSNYSKNLRISNFLALIYISILKILICYLEIGHIDSKVITTLITQVLCCIFTVLELIIINPKYSNCKIAIISVIYGITFFTAEILDLIFYINHPIQYFLGIYILISIAKLVAVFAFVNFQSYYYMDLEDY